MLYSLPSFLRASRDLLPSILQGPCSSASSPGGPPPASSSSPCTPSHGGLSFSLQSKHLLAAHRFVPLHAPPSPADPHAEEESEEAPLLDSSSAVGLLDVHGVPLYAAHHPHGAQGVSLPVDVFVTERGEVALVSSTGQDAGDLLDVSGGPARAVLWGLREGWFIYLRLSVLRCIGFPFNRLESCYLFLSYTYLNLMVKIKTL